MHVKRPTILNARFNRSLEGGAPYIGGRTIIDIAEVDVKHGAGSVCVESGVSVSDDYTPVKNYVTVSP